MILSAEQQFHGIWSGQNNMTISDGKILELNLDKIKISSSGVDDFYWPVNPFEISTLYLKIFRSLITVLKGAKAKKLMGADAAIVLYPYFLHEVMSTYDAYLLVSRSLKDEVILNPSGNRWLNSVLQKNFSVDSSGVIQKLLVGPSRPKWWRAPFRVTRDLLVSRQECMARHSLKPINHKKNIISITINSLPISQAKLKNEKIYYKRLTTWFKKPKLASQSNNKVYDEIIESIISSVSESLLLKKMTLPDYIFDFFKAWLYRAIPLVEYHCKQLEKNTQKLPQRLWVDTAGNLWGRILARCVKNEGGCVTRFAHGAALGYYSSSTQHGTYELEDCDIYSVFTDIQASIFKTLFTVQDTVQEVMPNIRCVPNNHFLNSLADHRNIKNSEKTVMYVGPAYLGGNFHAGAIAPMHDIVLLDWEVRLLSAIQAWGMPVILKPHPKESICMATPSSLENLLGKIILNERFEYVYNSADIILIDHPQTSIFPTIILSGKPFVYIDFGVTEFSEHAFSLLKKRCPIVKGWYDENNRAQVDWEQLKTAINSAHKYSNNEFASYYFQ